MSNHYLPHSSLPKTLAETLTHEIKKGQLTDLLPGYRELMKRYKVSQTTVKSAIKILESQAVVSPPSKGRKRTILLKPNQSPKKQKTLLLLMVKKEVSTDYDQLSTGPEVQSWQQLMGKVYQHALPKTTPQVASRTINRLIKQYKPDSILSYVLPIEWNTAISKTKIPCYTLGGQFPLNMNQSGSGYRQAGATELALLKLKEKGHTRILYPIHPVHKLFKKYIIQSFKKIFPDFTDLHLEAYLPNLPDDLPDIWQSHLPKYYTHLKPTAIVVNTLDHLLAVLSFCHNNNLSIPQDLSIVCEFDTQRCEWIHPTPSRMAYPFHLQHKHFLKWIKSDCTSTDTTYFPLSWIDGHTIKDLTR